MLKFGERAERRGKGSGAMFCKHCGAQIDSDCVVCPRCGKQVGELKSSQQPVIINNTNVNQNTVGGYVGRPKDKIVALLLCIFLGTFGVHKFYEGKIGMGLLYLFTFGLFGIGWLVDIIIILTKPNPYYV
ncbi:NINE protein [Acutalibacter sp.]|uniref:TM2 domain-containing protein n=1 Tax=Acutalibacter sp. TaxID=1918636 RepID=UPI0034E052FD